MACAMEACELVAAHTPFFHCDREHQHCVSMSATCNGEHKMHNHGIACCVCHKDVICVCEPDVGWVAPSCPIHGKQWVQQNVEVGPRLRMWGGQRRVQA